VVTKLIEQGADPRLPGCRGWTAIHYLVSRLESCTKDTTLKLIAELVEHDADPSAQNENGEKALHGLLNKYNELRTPFLHTIGRLNQDPGVATLAVVAKLLESGANPNIVNRIGQTGLHVLDKKEKMWCSSIRGKVAILFQNCGADPTI